MTVTLTVAEAREHVGWLDFCDVTGINEWALNEGQIDRNQLVTLTHEQAWSLGLLTIKPPDPDHQPDFT